MHSSVNENLLNKVASALKIFEYSSDAGLFWRSVKSLNISLWNQGLKFTDEQTGFF